MRCTASLRFVSRRFSTEASHSIVLRPYQETALQACTDALASGSTRIGVSLPTGSGKTTVFITALSRIKPPRGYPNATRSLVIVNNIELARQTANQTARLFPGWSVEIEQGHKHKASGQADLTVATYQTLIRSNRLQKFDPSRMKAIIVDEAHHAAAPSYRSILSYFHPDIQAPDATDLRVPPPRPVPILGFSATFSRHDGLALGSVFERIVYHRDFLEMIKEQWLCDVRFTSVKAKIDLSSVAINGRDGDFNATSLASVINKPTINKLVVQSWLEKASGRKSTLVFCVNLAHVRDLTNEFRAAGVNAAYVYSGTPAAERKALISSFMRGEITVLLNCAILTEGTDIPNIDCVIVAKPTRSRNLFAQMIGRGMRLSPNTGKKDCHIIDFVDSTSRVQGVVCIPTMFGLDPSEIIDDCSIEVLEQRAAELDAQQSDLELTPPEVADNIPAPKSVTFIDYDDPFSFVEQSSGAPHISKLSRLAWVGCGGDIYVLECMGKGHIRVEPVENSEDPEVRYQAHYTPPTLGSQAAAILKISPFQRKKKVLSARTLEEAIRGCDKYAIAVVKESLAKGLLRNAAWRRGPATDAQRKMVGKLWEKRSDMPESVKSAKLASLTKGEAANIITRVKHGALTRHAKKMKAQAKVEAAIEKEKKRRAREHVAVGPLPAAI